MKASNSSLILLPDLKNPPIAAHCYYLQITDDSMETNEGISFPINSYICVDPYREVLNNHFVVAQPSSKKDALFRQLITLNSKPFLHSLNPNYSDSALEEDAIIYGIICQHLKFF